MPQPRVRAVVLNYNGGDLVAQTFAALEATEWPRDRLELVMIDNASTDDSRDRVAARFPDVGVIDSPVNTGFPANNLALRDLGDVDYVALINNDAFVEPGWLVPLVDALAADPRRGAACPKLVLASRFVDVEITTPALAGVSGDPRTLGVQVRAVKVDGRDVLAKISGSGVHGLEVDGDGAPFRWTAASGTIRVPVTGPDADDGDGPWRVEITARRVDGTEALRLATGDDAVSALIGARDTTVTGTVTGPTYQVINNAGSVVLRDGSGADRGLGQPDDDRFDQPVDVFAWCGGAVLLRPAYLRDVGLFDESFFLYYEDTDLSWRGQLAGWDYHYVPTSVVRHVHAATSVEGSPVFRHYTERNRLAMLTKNAPPELAWRAPLRFLWATGAYAWRDVVGEVRRARRPRWATVRARLGSFAGWVSMLPRLVAQRRRIRRSAVRDDVEILPWLVDTAEVTPVGENGARAR